MRYVVALAVAAGLIGALLFYTQWAVSSVEAKVRNSLRDRQAAGTLPPELQGIDPASADLRDMGIQLPAADMRRLRFAGLLREFRFVWGPAIVGLCVGAAFLTRRGKPNRSSAVPAQSRK